MSKTDHQNTENNKKTPDTQPGRIKKRQQRYLMMGLIALAVIGWMGYSIFSTPSASSASKKSEKDVRVDIANPATHVDAASIWVERTQNELAKTQKKTEDLQQQLQLLNQQKAAQEQANQAQNDMLEVLQSKMKALQAQLEQANFAKVSGGAANAVTTPSLSSAPLIKPLQGVSDDLLALSTKSVVTPPNVIKPSKTPNTFVPAGTFVRAVMLGGADASAGVNSQGNPTPVLFRLLDAGTLPNHHRSHLKDCVATAAAIGDISSERGQMRLERLSCVSPNQQEVIELSVEGTVFGPEGKNGVRGVPLWREGTLLKRAFVAGTLSGFSQGISSQYTTSSISPMGAVSSVNNADIFKFGAAQGVSNAMDKIADYNIRRADQYHPVIQLSAGTVVDIVFLKGFYLDGQKHDNQESILPPFEPAAALAPVMAAMPTVPVTTSSSSPFPSQPISSQQQAASFSATSNLPVAPLPLTPTQVQALKTQTNNAPFFKQ